MPLNYKAPGVYVEEVSGGAKPIEAVPTSIACFIGFTEKAEFTKVIDRHEIKEPVARKPLLVTSWDEYRATFGSFVPGIYTPLSVYGFFENGGTKCYIVSIAQLPQKRNQIGIPTEKPPLNLTTDDPAKQALLEEVKAAVDAANAAKQAAESAETTAVSAAETAKQAAADANTKAEAARQAENIANRAQSAAKQATVAAEAAVAAAETVKDDNPEAVTSAQTATTAAQAAKVAAETKAQTAKQEAQTAKVEAQKAEQAANAAKERAANTMKEALKARMAAEKAEQDARAAKKIAGVEDTDEDSVPKQYLTITANQVTSDPTFRVKVQPVEQQPNPQGQSETEYELLVERLSQIVTEGTEPWREVERRFFQLLKTDNGEFKLKYRSDVKPKSVTLTIGKPDSGSVPTLSVARRDGVAIAINSSEIGSVDAKVLIGGDDSAAGSIVDSLVDIEDISIICMPDLMIPLRYPKTKLFDGGQDVNRFVQAIQQMMISHCENMGDRVVILDPPPHKTPQEIKRWRMNETGYDSSYATLYYPWIKVLDPATNEIIEMPPSGHVAGIWSRSDNQRGVHKAPANEVVRGTVELAFDVSMRHQEILNPEGINCIRFFPGRGYRVWGARTLSSDPEWRYLNVRRLFNMMKLSIQRGTQWAVFEPNDQRLWAKVRRDVNNFLMGLYSQGMLFGATAKQAYFVKCDESNNPHYTRDLGYLLVDIGVAPVKPAEFIVFRIQQWSPEASGE